MNGHAVMARVLDATQVQDLRPVSGHLQGLFRGEDGIRRADGTIRGIGGEDPVDVSVDLADVGLERGGQRDGRECPSRRGRGS